MPGQHLQLMVNRQKLPISSGVTLIWSDLNKVKSQYHCGAWSPYKCDRKGLAGHTKTGLERVLECELRLHDAASLANRTKTDYWVSV